MSKEQTQVWICTCEKCGHKWLSNTIEVPKRCANNKCKNRKWDNTI